MKRLEIKYVLVELETEKEGDEEKEWKVRVRNWKKKNRFKNNRLTSEQK